MALHPPFLHRLDAIASELYTYSVPMASGEVRKGLLIHFCETNTWGEAAPLPGRSRESYDEAREQLLTLFSSEPKKPLYPSVRFALESALSPLPKLPIEAPVWALISGTVDQTLKQVASSKATHIKIKLGHLSLVQARVLMQELRSCRAELRVDCNRAFTFDEAVALFDGCEQLIEEPTHQISRLPDFPFPFAIDETLEEYPNFPIDSCPNLSTLILKPTIHGGRAGCNRFTHLGKKLLFTGAYETGIATLHILTLAQELCGNPLQPLGLSTYGYLAEDLYIPRFHIDDVNLQIATIPQVDSNRIEKIASGTLKIDLRPCINFEHSQV